MGDQFPNGVFPFLESDGLCNDYVMRPKMMKISFVWGRKIAFLGNSKKGNFDGLCNNVKNDEIFFSLGKQNCLFRKLLIT